MHVINQSSEWDRCRWHSIRTAKSSRESRGIISLAFNVCVLLNCIASARGYLCVCVCGSELCEKCAFMQNWGQQWQCWQRQWWCLIVVVAHWWWWWCDGDDEWDFRERCHRIGVVSKMWLKMKLRDISAATSQYLPDCARAHSSHAILAVCSIRTEHTQAGRLLLGICNALTTLLCNVLTSLLTLPSVTLFDCHVATQNTNFLHCLNEAQIEFIHYHGFSAYSISCIMSVLYAIRTHFSIQIRCLYTENDTTY